MITNPTKWTWSAPTEREDGSPIVGGLTYTMWLNGEEFQSLPGSLNPDGTYEAIFTVTEPGSYETYLTATETYSDGKSKTSAPSNIVAFEVTSAPLAPTALAVE